MSLTNRPLNAMRRRPVLHLIGALVGSALLVGCSRPQATKKAATPEALPVEVQSTTTGTVYRWTPVTGSLVSLHDVNLSSRVPGRIAAVYVREGDTVKPGEVVARLDMSDQENQVRSAEGAVSGAFAKLAQSQAAYRQQLVSSQSVLRATIASYDQQKINTRTGIASAQSGVEAAKAQLSQVREGSRTQEIRRSETQVGVARAGLAKAQSDLRRYRDLANQGAAAPAALDEYVTEEAVARENLNAAQETLSLMKEGARSQEITQTEQIVRQAEDRLRQARAAGALDEVRKADVENARAALAQNEVRRAEVQASRAALDQTRSALAISRKALVDSAIRCPIAGQVATRNAEPEQVVAPGTPLIRVVALDTVYFEPSVPDTDIRYIHVGQQVDVNVNAFPQRKFRGSVTKIYPLAAQINRAFPIRITITNSEGLLRPQMFAQGRIESERHTNIVLVPRDALLRQESNDPADDHAKVFIVVNGITHERQVRMGLSNDSNTMVEVTGLQSGAKVVTAGQRSLSDGDHVTVSNGAKTAAR